MENVKTINDINHFAFFRILDILKENCERQNGDEPIAPLKYADIFNFSVSCQKFRRIVWDWSLSMYHSLEIDLLYVVPHKKITVNFAEIHKSLQGATKQKRDLYMDRYIKSMMGNSHLRTIKLLYDQPGFNTEHSSILEEIVMGLQGKAKRITLDSDKIPKFKEIIVDIAYCEIRNLHLFRNISKLSLTASFKISDLKKFCINNPSLVYLEVNQYLFSDYGKLTEIVPHCPNLKNLKFLLNDNVWDNDYVGLSRLKRLKQLEIVTTIPNNPIFELPDKNKEWHNVQDCESIGEVSTALQSIPILQLLTAFGENEKSSLFQLSIGFDIDDQMAQAIEKIKNLRVLECGGFCDPKSIRLSIARHPKLNRLSLLSKGPLLTDDIAALIEKQVIVSNLDLKYRFQGSVLSCEGNEDSFWLENLEPFLKLKNLKELILPVKRIVSMESTMVRFLEQGVKIICKECEIRLDPQERILTIFPPIDFDIFLFVTNLRCLKLFSESMPTIQFLLHLSEFNLETLQELYIFPTHMSGEPLNKAVVEALSTLKCLRKISCGFQELIYILPLAQLKDLESIVVSSEHHPENEHFPLCLYPILRNCNKLSFFKIQIPVDGISEKFLISLERVVMMTRDQGILDIHIIWNGKPHGNNQSKHKKEVEYLNDKQLKLIKRPFERIRLTVEKKIHDDEIF